MDPRRIAVLYFDDHSAGGELGYLADALTEAVIHELGQVSTLEVISRNGVKRFRGMDTDLNDVVRELRVGSIVEGSVARVADGVRITFQLIDGRDLAHVHSGTVDGPAGEWLALHDELVADVARALRRQLGDVVSIQRRRRGNQSDEAWDLVSRASRLRSDFVTLRTEDAAAGVRLLNRADSLLARAERLDPDWIEPVLARGYVARHLALAAGAADGAPDSAWIGRALGHAEGAIALGVDSARALELRGSLRMVAARRLSGPERARMRDAAERDLREAVDQDRERGRAWGWLSELLVEQSRFEEGRLAAHHALEADEFLEQERGTLWAMAYSALQFGPDDDAIQYCDEGRRRFPEISDFIICRLMILASFPQVDPDIPAGWRLTDSLAQVVPGTVSEQWHAYGAIHVAKIAARRGLPDSARAIARRARGPETPAWLSYNEAYLNLLLGDTAGAIGLLRIALTEEVADSALIARDWWFEPLHGRSDFAALLGRHAPEPR